MYAALSPFQLNSVQFPFLLWFVLTSVCRYKNRPLGSKSFAHAGLSLGPNELYHALIAVRKQFDSGLLPAVGSIQA